MKNFKNYFLSLAFIPTILTAQESSSSSDPSAGTFYFVLGAGGDIPLNNSYEAAGLKRKSRLDFKAELGTNFFAVPFHYSDNQNVKIFGLKPRLQFLFPLGSTRILVGPGVGGVVNYWYSDFSVLGQSLEANVLELGAQGSLQAVIRPAGPFIILVTPAAIDFNMWREAWVSHDQKRVGNFSTVDKKLGFIYSGGIALGIGF